MKKLTSLVFIIGYFCCFLGKAQNKWVLHSYGYGTKTNSDAYEWKYSFSKYLIEVNDSLFTCDSLEDTQNRYYFNANKKTIGDSIMYLYGESSQNIVGAFYYKITLNDSVCTILEDTILTSIVKNKIQNNEIGSKYVHYRGLSDINYIGNNLVEFKDNYNFLLYWGICRKYSENLLEITIIPKGGFDIYAETSEKIVQRFIDVNPFQYKIYLDNSYYNIK